MKIREITVSKSGVIPKASYSNLRPGYSITIEVDENEDPNELILKCKEIVNKHFELDEYREAVNLIQKQFKEIRLYDGNEGLKYPSISSILNYDKEWTISKGELLQYGSLGTILHEVFWYALNSYTNTGKIVWKDPREFANLQKEIGIVLNGSLKLNWNDYSYQTFGNEYIPKIKKIYGIEQIVLNPDIRVGGRYDLIAEIELDQTMLAVIDLKSGGYDFRQLAFYGRTWEQQNDKKIDAMVVFPIGKTTNKCGFSKPIIETDIDLFWDKMLEKREEFRNDFNI
ncbi:MAG: hypothetical protein WC535_08295 [Candidatus Cloacimonas sp.]